jgi:hypothetical protein
MAAGALPSLFRCILFSYILEGLQWSFKSVAACRAAIVAHLFVHEAEECAGLVCGDAIVG